MSQLFICLSTHACGAAKFFISILIWIDFLINFWRPLWEAVCDILGAKGLQNGRLFGIMFGVISGTLDFQFFVTLIMKTCTFPRSEGTPKSRKCCCFLEVAFGGPFGCGFCSLVGSLGGAFWLQQTV